MFSIFRPPLIVRIREDDLLEPCCPNSNLNFTNKSHLKFDNSEKSRASYPKSHGHTLSGKTKDISISHTNVDKPALYE